MIFRVITFTFHLLSGPFFTNKKLLILSYVYMGSSLYLRVPGVAGAGAAAEAGAPVLVLIMSRNSSSLIIKVPSFSA